MPESVLNILDVKVHFPFAPYDCQKLYMKKVIEALKERKNAILESPTGTGKTLSLLCSILSWREHLFSLCADPNKRNPQFKVPKILYASRTHQQLDQVVKELRKTSYKVSTSVMSSRDNLCIKPSVTRAGSGMKRIQACKTAIKRNQCEYFNKVKDNNAQKICASQLSSTFVFDIEDLVSLGHQHTICPYYFSRDLDTQLDFCLMPYNYLINNGSHERDNDLKTTEELITGNIVVFDEAHNIEKFCEDALSTAINSYELKKCLAEIDWILTTKFDVAVDYRAIIELQKIVQLLHTQFILVTTKFTSKPPPLLSSQKPTHTQQPTSENIKNDNSIIETCEYFFENILKPSTISFDNFNLIINHIDMCISYLLTYGGKSHTEEFSLHKLRGFLQTISYSTNYITNSTNQSTYTNQRLLHKHSRPTGTNYKKLNDTFYICFSMPKHSIHDDSDNIINVQYWCFTSSIAMNAFNKAYCVILTSGTLAPFDMILKEVSLPFPVQLENTHILKENNLSVNILPRALDDKTPLLFTYSNRLDANLITKFGQSLVLLMERIPDGTLVFFPSYNLLESFVRMWKKSGILSHLAKTKHIVMESKDKCEYKDCVKQHHDNLEKNSNTPQRINGSVLIGVFRGKISEGINFSDKACRAVIVVGIPYPPQNDPKIVLKRKSLENQQSNENNEVGKTWYQYQAMRAVNQAIGRVIRHKDDFGMIFLMDERFRYDSNRKCLPLWIQRYINNFKTFESLLKETCTFFKQHDQSYSNIEQFTSIGHFLEGKKSTVEITRPNFCRPIVKKPTSRVDMPVKRESAENIDSALKRLKEVENEQLAVKNASVKSSGSLRELLSRKNSKPLARSTTNPSTVENCRLISYAKKDSTTGHQPIIVSGDCGNFSAEQQKLLKLLKLFVDDTAINDFKSICSQYYANKDIDAFIELSSKLLPPNVLPKLKEFILFDHKSIFDIYLSNVDK